MTAGRPFRKGMQALLEVNPGVHFVNLYLKLQQCAHCVQKDLNIISTLAKIIICITVCVNHSRYLYN